MRGVHWDKHVGKWRAMLYIDGRQKGIGYFRDIDEAAAAVRAARELHYGEFAGRG